jgi:hypothetical protein
MKKLFVIVLACISIHTQAQLVNCNAFLKGPYLEAAINQAGSFGSTISASLAFHPMSTALSFYDPCDSASAYGNRTRALGFIADPDKDGWFTGSPAFFGDYFLPGVPQEGWAISANGADATAYTPSLQTSGSSGFSSTALSGANSSYGTLYKTITAVWTGNYHLSSTSNLSIVQVTTFDTSSLHLTIRIALKNTGTSALTNVYYMRTLDPDNDISISGDYSTRNVVTGKNPNVNNRVAISTWGLHYTKAFLGLGTIDCRAKAFVVNGLSPATGVTLASIYAGTASGFHYDSLSADDGVGIIYSFGNMNPGDSVNFTYVYAFTTPEFESALAYNKNWTSSADTVIHNSGDTVVVCKNSTVLLNALTLGYDNWSWSSSAGSTITQLSPTTAYITVGTSPAVVTAHGSSSTCYTSANITMIIVPIDTLPLITIAGTSSAKPGDVVNLTAVLTNAGSNYRIVWYRNGVVLDTTTTNIESYTKSSGDDTITALLIHPGQNCYRDATSNSWVVAELLGISSINNSAGNIYVYPNPFRNQINISGLQVSDLITVFDMTGKSIIRWTAKLSGNNIFNTSQLLPGIYIIRISDKNGIIKARLPMQKL